MTPMRTFFILPALLTASLLGVPQEPETPPLTIKVRPELATSPGSVRLTAMVDPHENNRRLTLSADSGTYYRSSTVQLDGEAAPREHAMLFTHLPAGKYTLEARLGRSDGSEIVEDLEVLVVE